MSLVLTAAPTVEPLSLAEAKAHLRLDAAVDALDTVQSIAPGAHVIAASYSLAGSSVDVLGYSATAFLEAGACGAGGSVACKLQHSTNGTTWTDVTAGAFTTVTEANDNATQQMAYTGDRRYLRAVATVAVATCEFGVFISRQTLVTTEDDLIESLIVAARNFCQDFTHRQFVTATWTLYLDAFPGNDETIELPNGPIQSVSSVKYYDTNGTLQTLSASGYQVDIKAEPGRLLPAYGSSWPSIRDVPNAVAVEYLSGYGAAASSVPDGLRHAIRLLVAHWYEFREAAISGTIIAEVPLTVERLLWPYRVLTFA